MPQIPKKVLIYSFICVLSVAVLLAVATQALDPEESVGLRAGKWTAIGEAESLLASSGQSGNARLDELESFEVEASLQESPFVNLTLRYRDGTMVAVIASSEMQAGYLQATLKGSNETHAFVSFKQKNSPSMVEVTDGLLLARFQQ